MGKRGVAFRVVAAVAASVLAFALPAGSAMADEVSHSVPAASSVQGVPSSQGVSSTSNPALPTQLLSSASNQDSSVQKVSSASNPVLAASTASSPDKEKLTGGGR
ncbi:hypothetical protein [Bifidobacterium sp. ESL0745]|uniref:hypothetical protein n=1 Tax=Bifidobacterium sp. ESL0745 TaxID=2983226 RepID=UPI0023F6C354|nr:hypothetical protein [Bifidobacterium sp. ESL0745]MDF7665617.1 hypothetical protein [Bifidobacterium sp. ESL0745]